MMKGSTIAEGKVKKNGVPAVLEECRALVSMQSDQVCKRSSEKRDGSRNIPGERNDDDNDED